MVYAYLTPDFRKHISRELWYIIFVWSFSVMRFLRPLLKHLMSIRPFVRPSVRFLQSATLLTVTTQLIDLLYTVLEIHCHQLTSNLRWKKPDNLNITASLPEYFGDISYIPRYYLTDRLSQLSYNVSLYYYYYYKCGHRNVQSKRQVWMSIFHIINFRKKKSWTQGSWIFFTKKLILDYYFCLKTRVLDFCVSSCLCFYFKFSS